MEVKAGDNQIQAIDAPQGWMLTRMGSVLRFQVGFPFSSAFFNEVGFGIRLVKNRDLKSDDQVFHYTGPYDPTYLVADGDVLVGMDGDFLPCLWGKGQALLNQRVGRILPLRGLDRVFAYYFLMKPLKEVEAATSSTTVKHLSHGNIEGIEKRLPPEPEQRAIAEALSDVDALLLGLDRLIAKKRDLKQAAMQQLLTGQTRLPGFQGGWQVKPLGTVVSIQKGQLITAKTLVPGDVPVIAGGRQPAYFHAVANRFGRTITISASGASAGYVAIHEGPIFASDCSTISGGDGYSLDFIYYQLLLRQALIYKAQTGGAQPHVHAKDLNPIPFSVPQFDEQAAIADVLRAMDAELTALEARRDKTRALKQAMMQELLTGRTRLV